MKIIKLLLVVSTIVAICIVVNNLRTEEVIRHVVYDDIDADDDETKRISKKINRLKTLSAFSLQKESYKIINDEIEMLIDNSDIKEKLQQMAYTAYTYNFIINSKNVFGRQTWKNNDVSFIRSEIEKLMASGFLEKTTNQMNIDLIKIKKCIKDYDKINTFTSLKGFQFNDDGPNPYLLSYEFPFDSLKSKISKIDFYRKLINKSEYLKNNKKLSDRLDRMKSNGIIIYEDYVENKIAAHRESFKEMSAKNDPNLFLTKIKKPLKSVIDNFKNNCNDNEYNYNEERIANIKAELENIDFEARTRYFKSN
tara:strand:+ start:526 stop:1452 length:927 start_codon:yes stop_codon:yes gene_type:complete